MEIENRKQERTAMLYIVKHANSGFACSSKDIVSICSLCSAK